MLSPPLFAIVLAVVTENARRVINEMLHADDLVLISETTKDIKEKFWS